MRRCTANESVESARAASIGVVSVGESSVDARVCAAMTNANAGAARMGGAAPVGTTIIAAIVNAVSGIVASVTSADGCAVVDVRAASIGALRVFAYSVVAACPVGVQRIPGTSAQGVQHKKGRRRRASASRSVGARSGVARSRALCDHWRRDHRRRFERWRSKRCLS